MAFAVSATDPDDPVRATTCAPASGATFPLGSTTVRCTAADTHLNDATATFVVTVADTTPPAFAGVPGPVVADATTPSGALVAYAMPTATDLVDGAVAVGCSPSSGALFPIGTSIVLCRAVDAHGNVAKASFKVLVNGALVQLDALIKKVSGTSFATPLLTAKTYLQKSDLVDGCAQLSEFDREVLGASLLKPYQASSWLAVSAQIETVAGCKR